MTDLNSTIDSSCAELARSMDALFDKHGGPKAATAMMLHNTGVLLAMLKRHGTDAGLLYMLERHLIGMTDALCGAAGLDVGEITKIASGIDEQCAMLTADVLEAEKQTNKEGPCQEK